MADGNDAKIIQLVVSHDGWFSGNEESSSGDVKPTIYALLDNGNILRYIAPNEVEGVAEGDKWEFVDPPVLGKNIIKKKGQMERWTQYGVNPAKESFPSYFDNDK